MKRAIQFGVLAAFLTMVAGTVKADTYSYTLTLNSDPSVTLVSFDLQEFPAMDPSQPVPFPGAEDSSFFVTPTNLVINGTASSDVLEFFNSSMLGGFEDIPSMSPTPAFNFVGPQLYSGDEAGNDPTNPLQMSLGVFTTLLPCEDLNCDTVGTTPYTLSVADVTTPEPATLLLFGTGLMALILMRKRFAVN